jgi:arginyl-tRNA--protein-N-Asp/Glu arginylyltransferase
MDTPAGVKPKHVYTIELHRAMFTEELYELYIRYEKAVHKKDRERDNLKRFLCNSPVYDAEKDFIIRDSPSLENC